ncbi:MAG: transcription elongation factor GreA [Oscillospiraceae bacterium]|nr:transcription elongation factor GreA [Oscillospiraceae bacterium]
MAVEKFKMSQERYDQLKDELHYMETVREREVAEQIKEARSFGDLSENSEYDEAKAEQGKLYSKIAEVKNLLENAEIVEVEVVAKGVVGIGSKVRVLDMEDNSETDFQLVGSQEANPMQGKISDDSPIGKALMGHKKNEVVTVEAPAGSMKFKILSVESN